jgi:hypothetical protein
MDWACRAAVDKTRIGKNVRMITVLRKPREAANEVERRKDQIRRMAKRNESCGGEASGGGAA